MTEKKFLTLKIFFVYVYFFLNSSVQITSLLLIKLVKEVDWRSVVKI